jgi:hypothetical protein
VSPETHLIASWLLAAKTTDNPRDCSLVALAGVAPDLDGLGVVADLFNAALGRAPTGYFEAWHHVFLHGAFGAVLIAASCACFARDRWRAAGLAFLAVHLHLACDLLGSRGPSPGEFWPIRYLAPFSSSPAWVWRGQWPLNAWPNHLINLALLAASLVVAARLGRSPAGVFSLRADAVFVATLRKWRDQIFSTAPEAGDR